MEGFKFTPFKDVNTGRKAMGWGNSPEPLFAYYGTTMDKGMHSRMQASMGQMIGSARELGVGDEVIRQLEGYRAEVPRNTFLSGINFKALYESSTSYAQNLRKQESENKLAQQEAEQSAALEQQRKEAQRLQTYATNVGSGDLSGPGTPPTVISGGSQSVDSSRLEIGGSSTARRRRGRGISAQLGL